MESASELLGKIQEVAHVKLVVDQHIAGKGSVYAFLAVLIDRLMNFGASKVQLHVGIQYLTPK